MGEEYVFGQDHSTKKVLSRERGEEMVRGYEEEDSKNGEDEENGMVSCLFNH